MWFDRWLTMKLGYSLKILSVHVGGISDYKLCFKSILYHVWYGAMLHLVISYQASWAILEKWYQTVQDVKHAGVHPEKYGTTANGAPWKYN